MQVMLPEQQEEVHTYTHYGAVSELFWLRVPEILLAGPAGTGKSRGCLEKIHACALKYAGMRGLMTRKYNTDLVGAALVEFRSKVLHPRDNVRFFGGNRERPPAYIYPNGSEIVVGGLDDSSKIMSTQYDIAYVQEATEVEEENIEDLTSRLRNNVMPYQQLIMDANPQQPTHPLKLRCDRGQCRLLVSLHKDNPTVTAAYLQTLANLTGVRRLRLYLGIWAAAEGVVYDNFSEGIHIVDTLPAHFAYYIGAQDWGYTNPGVFGVFGVTNENKLYLLHELYATGKTVDGWWVPEVRALHRHYKLQRLLCDPSEPDFIQQYSNAGFPARKAQNAIAPGVGAVRQRLDAQTLFFWRQALRHRDDVLFNEHKPLCTVQEFSGYVWPKDKAGKPVKEKPEPGIDHGMDMIRYAVASLDVLPRRPTRGAVAKPKPAFVPR